MFASQPSGPALFITDERRTCRPQRAPHPQAESLFVSRVPSKQAVGSRTKQPRDRRVASDQYSRTIASPVVAEVHRTVLKVLSDGGIWTKRDLKPQP